MCPCHFFIYRGVQWEAVNAIHQHLPQKDSQDSPAGHHQQPRTVATKRQQPVEDDILQRRSVTPSTSLHPASQGKPSPGTLRGKGRNTKKHLTPSPGESWNDWPRTAMAGGHGLAAYLQDGVKG